MEDLQTLFGEIPPGIRWTISPEDTLYRPDPKGYVGLGLGALRCIKLALLAAGKEKVERILDLPCGYGRVLRVLRAAFPQAELTAADRNAGAITFCKETFGAVPVFLKEHPENIRLRGRFDLIWCGSFFQRFDQARWAALLRLFESRLRPRGILVFTTNGRWIADKVKEGKRDFGLSPEALAALLEPFEHTGFGYTGPPPGKTYGTALSSPEWVCALLRRESTLRLLSFAERGWARHYDKMGQEDCIACIRELASPPATTSGEKGGRDAENRDAQNRDAQV
jgi:SAM-dependent methyltransferase